MSQIYLHSRSKSYEVKTHRITGLAEACHGIPTHMDHISKTYKKCTVIGDGGY